MIYESFRNKEDVLKEIEGFLKAEISNTDDSELFNLKTAFSAIYIAVKKYPEEFKKILSNAVSSTESLLEFYDRCPDCGDELTEDYDMLRCSCGFIKYLA